MYIVINRTEYPIHDIDPHIIIFENDADTKCVADAVETYLVTELGFSHGTTTPDEQSNATGTGYVTKTGKIREDHRPFIGCMNACVIFQQYPLICTYEWTSNNSQQLLLLHKERVEIIVDFVCSTLNSETPVTVEEFKKSLREMLVNNEYTMLFLPEHYDRLDAYEISCQRMDRLVDVIVHCVMASGLVIE